MSNWKVFAIVVGVIVRLYKVMKDIIVYFYNRRIRIREERMRVMSLIGIRYFNMMCVVKTARDYANQVNERNMSFLDEVNSSLRKINRLLLDSVNTGSTTDLELSEIRNAFGNDAVTIVNEMTKKLAALDCELKEPGLSYLTCSSKVVDLCDFALGQWNKLVSIMAKKVSMSTMALNDFFCEKLNGE